MTTPNQSGPHVRSVALLALAFVLALWGPNPMGPWSPLSILLWGLAGNPEGAADAFRSVVYGGGLLALYTASAFIVIRWALERLGVRVARGATELTRTKHD